MLQILTATGARPEAFALCKRWMARQTYSGDVRWIIVDDGEKPQPIDLDFRAGWQILHVRREPYWRPGQNTQAVNMLFGLNYVDRKHPLAIIEDDDWYAPDWLDHVDTQLREASLVGETRARYYNVNTRHSQQLQNASHASLCATAMRDSAIDGFRGSCELREKFIDLRLWQTHRDKRLFDGHRVVGIKGMPGRLGIGMGHNEGALRGEHDPHGDLLRQWIDGDATAYLSQ